MALKIGFTNKYFTLWDVRLETEYFTNNQGKSFPHYNRTYYTYYQNLSFDKSKAIEKAKLKGCVDLEVDEELRGTTRSWVKTEKIELPPEVFEPYEFHYGKNFRKDIRECEEVGYVKWFYGEGNFKSDEQRTILMNRAVELRPDWLVIYDDKLETIDYVESLKIGIEREKSIKENGYFEAVSTKNCDDEGRLWLGIDVRFPKTRYNEYRGFQYYLPVFDGKQVRIKNKNLRYYIKEKSDDFWIISGVQKIQ